MSNLLIVMLNNMFTMYMTFCSTGQKYIYTGSSDSSVYIYDLVCTCNFFFSSSLPLYQYLVLLQCSVKNNECTNACVEGNEKCNPPILVLYIRCIQRIVFLLYLWFYFKIG